MQKKEIQRGDLFYYDFGKREGSVQSGERPVMVIQADNFNANAPTIIVAAVTAVMKKKYLPSHIILGEDFGLKKPSMVLLEQIQTVNKDELTDYIGSVNDERLWKQINAALKKTFLMEKERQELLDLHCEATVDGYTDFIFINRFGQPQHQATLNKAIRRIIRDCNDEQLLKDENAEVLLPHFSCHSLRHTFTTRMCEAGVNVKVIQDTLGHKDISTTLNIYTDVTKELRKSEFEGLDSYFKNEYNKVSV